MVRRFIETLRNVLLSVSIATTGHVSPTTVAQIVTVGSTQGPELLDVSAAEQLGCRVGRAPCAAGCACSP